MKHSLIFLILLVCPILGKPQGEGRDLKTILNDSLYVFNRFDEVNIGVNGEIDSWKAPESMKADQKALYSSVLTSVRNQKTKINGLITKSDVSASELFDVYSELVYVDGVMKDESSIFETFGYQGKATELARISAKAGILAQNMNLVLAVKIMQMESDSDRCAANASSAAAKPK